MVETFNLVTGGGVPSAADLNIYEYHLTELMVDGVTFDAILRVDSSHPRFLSADSEFPGYGVKNATGVFVDNSEWIHFTLEVTNAVGGDAPVGRLSAIEYTPGPAVDVDAGKVPEIYLSTTPPPSAEVTLAVDMIGNFDVVALPSEVGLEVYSIAGEGGPEIAHLVYGVTATFSSAIAAVPEPSGFLFGGLVAAAAVGAAVRRKPRVGRV